MKQIQQLKKMFVLYKHEIRKIDSCVDWAVKRLEKDEEQGDLDISLLAGTSEEHEAEELIRIFEREASKKAL